MAVTYDRVTLSQVNFDMLGYDSTEHSQAASYHIGTPTNVANAVAMAEMASVYTQMIKHGLNTMNLYDNDQNVIGNLMISDFIYEFCTVNVYQTTYDGTYGIDTDTDTLDYPDYREDTTGSHYIGGAKFKRIVDATGISGVAFTISINNATYTFRDFSKMGFELHDSFGTWPAAQLERFLWFEYAFRSVSVGLMTKTTAGVEHKYLEFNENDGTQFMNASFDADKPADNLNITDYIIPEVGYMNELDNRFSPRAHSIMTGMYLVYVDANDTMMKLISEGLFGYKLSDWFESTFFGSDGKEYVVGINWFYGLRDMLGNKGKIFGPSDIRIGCSFLRYDEGPNDTISADNLGSEFVMWDTPELHIEGKFHDYRDYLASFKVFLPYYGFADLDPNDVVDAYIKVYYNINLYSRAADIVVTTRSERTNNLEEKILSVTTTMGEEIPFGADAARTMFTALAQTAGKAITTGASIALNAEAGQVGADIASNNAQIGYESGLVEHGLANAKSADTVIQSRLDENRGLRRNEAQLKAASNAIPSVPNMPVPAVNRSNGSGSENGSLDELHPYIMIQWPVTCEPLDWEDYVGTPTAKSVTLSGNLGFTQIGAVYPQSMANAPKYLDEIIAQLKAGVYL